MSKRRAGWRLREKSLRQKLGAAASNNLRLRLPVLWCVDQGSSHHGGYRPLLFPVNQLGCSSVSTMVRRLGIEAIDDVAQQLAEGPGRLLSRGRQGGVSPTGTMASVHVIPLLSIELRKWTPALSTPSGGWAAGE